ncbi:MAG: MMPL family transporter [Phycisphaerae bacterium]
MNIGEFIYSHRWAVLCLWLAGAAALMLSVPSPDPMAGLTTELLPADSTYNKALDELADHFGDRSGRSEAVVVFERAGGPLTDTDLDDVERLGRSLVRLAHGSAGKEDFRSVLVRTPRRPEGKGDSDDAATAMAKDNNPLLSADGRAAMVVVNLPYGDATAPAVRVVNRVHRVVDESRFEPGLATAVTGSAGYGRDYILATERSDRKIMVVTIIAVITILMAVYRAPLAAIIPLVGIGLATAAATKLMILGQGIGFGGGTAERLFMLVLLYGAGVDYSVLFISRYKEFLTDLRPPAEAMAMGLNASIGAVLFSAGTTAAGLATLCFARFGVFHDVGPAIVLALVVAAFASVTLVPATVAILGPRIFWPGRVGPASAANRLHLPSPLAWVRDIHERFWPALARSVTARPALVLIVTLAALLGPAVRGARLTWGYDAQSSIKSGYDAVRGIEMVNRHWSIGQISPVTVLAVAKSAHVPAEWEPVCATIVANLRAIDGVDNIRGLMTPLGLHARPGANAFVRLFGKSKVQEEFLSRNGRAMRLLVFLKTSPQTLAAMDDAGRIRTAAQEGLAQTGTAAKVHLTGPTAETVDMRDVTQSDFLRTAVMALAIILVIVVALLRDVVLSVFMVAATVLGYAATLGLTYWAFTSIGHAGLDWEVEVFLFIVLVAVGQDYNIFFAVRLAQEGATSGVAEATAKALVHTGRVISSCGIIMAATLGSMVVGDVKMLQQLGFALAMGMLIDTFVVRPLLLPAFIVLTGRTLRRASSFIRRS